MVIDVDNYILRMILFSFDMNYLWYILKKLIVGEKLMFVLVCLRGNLIRNIFCCLLFTITYWQSRASTYLLQPRCSRIVTTYIFFFLWFNHEVNYDIQLTSIIFKQINYYYSMKFLLFIMKNSLCLSNQIFRSFRIQTRDKLINIINVMNNIITNYYITLHGTF